jgi:hypothetical protein
VIIPSKIMVPLCCCLSFLTKPEHHRWYILWLSRCALPCSKLNKYSHMGQIEHHKPRWVLAACDPEDLSKSWSVDQLLSVVNIMLTFCNLCIWGKKN